MCMFILLYITFGKFRQAGLVLSIVPLALFGGMLALNLRGMTLNVSSAVGFIAMFGLSIQNGIIMVSQINELRRKGANLFNAVSEGARQRFRPILMTSATTIIGLLPASVAIGIGSDTAPFGYGDCLWPDIFDSDVDVYLARVLLSGRKQNNEKQWQT